MRLQLLKFFPFHPDIKRTFNSYNYIQKTPTTIATSKVAKFYLTWISNQIEGFTSTTTSIVSTWMGMFLILAKTRWWWYVFLFEKFMKQKKETFNECSKGCIKLLTAWDPKCWYWWWWWCIENPLRMTDDGTGLDEVPSDPFILKLPVKSQLLQWMEDEKKDMYM